MLEHTCLERASYSLTIHGTVAFHTTHLHSRLHLPFLVIQISKPDKIVRWIIKENRYSRVEGHSVIALWLYVHSLFFLCYFQLSNIPAKICVKVYILVLSRPFDWFSWYMIHPFSIYWYIGSDIYSLTLYLYFRSLHYQVPLIDFFFIFGILMHIQALNFILFLWSRSLTYIFIL